MRARERAPLRAAVLLAADLRARVRAPLRAAAALVVDFLRPVLFFRPVAFFRPVVFLRAVDFFRPVVFLRAVDFFRPVVFLRRVVLRAAAFLRPVVLRRAVVFFLPVLFLRPVLLRPVLLRARVRAPLRAAVRLAAALRARVRAPLRAAAFLLPVVFFAAKTSTSVLHRVGCIRQPISPYAHVASRALQPSQQLTNKQLCPNTRGTNAHSICNYASFRANVQAFAKSSFRIASSTRVCVCMRSVRKRSACIRISL